MISFRRKKKTDPFADVKSSFEKPPELETKIEAFGKGMEKIKTGVEKEIIEDLSKRIEEENRRISRKFNGLTKKAKEITLESPEIVDLIKLYSSSRDRFEKFVEEMQELEYKGWSFDNDIAAFHKFRVGKALAEMKKQTKNVENVCRNAGFTPSNIKVILESPIERLVDSLVRKKIKVKKTKK